MKVQLRLLIGLLAFSLIFISSCSSKKKAIGNEDDIIVVADSSLYYEVEPELLQVFEKIVYTPQPENLFNLQRKDYVDLNIIKTRKNIIILGTLNDSGYVSQYIRKSLDSNVTSLVRESQEYVINKYNVWAEGQLVMYLVSPTVEQLKKNILSGHEQLLYSFRNISDKRLFAKLYRPKYEKLETEAKLLHDYNWVIYIPKHFEVGKNSPEDNFVWLRGGRKTPVEKWIFIHWIDNASPDYLNRDSIIAIRNRITKKHFTTTDNTEYVEISNDFSEPMFSEVNFDSRYAIMTQGFWRFNDKSGGGPFTSYSFLDQKTGRFYMVDGSIYAPKYYKKELIQQVDVLLNSFRTSDELSDEKKADLLDNYESEEEK